MRIYKNKSLLKFHLSNKSKKNIILCLLTIFAFSKNIYSQSNGAAAAGVITGLATIGSAIMAIEDLKESAELTGTQWVLANHPELKSFSLKTLDFNGKRIKDMSTTTVVTFKIQEFTPSDNPKLDGKKQILFAFTSQGWISENGIDYNKVSWYLIDEFEWLNMMTAYAKVSSEEKNDSTIKEVLKNGKIVDRGIKLKGKTEIPFYKLEGDMYLVTDYSEDMKLVYNERSLGIFLKKIGDLVQLRRGSIIEIHEFLFSDK